MGAGGASLYVPRYITEIAPTRIRGQLSSFNQVSPCLRWRVQLTAGAGFDRHLHLKILLLHLLTAGL